MKKIIIWLSAIIMLILVIGTYMYEKQHPIDYPGQTQPVNEIEQQPEVLNPVDNETISYTLQKDELNLTYNNGEDWLEVPIEKKLLFQGEYQGNETELIKDSYLLTENRVAFLYAEENAEETQSVLLKYSLDQGDTWQESLITDSFSLMRFRKIDFLNETFGYAILSGDRTMSQEYSIVYLTHDNGVTWKSTAELPTTRLIASGSFTDEQTGFLSYGTINPEKPDVYFTEDGGNTWDQAEFNVPEKYQEVFVQAEVPIEEGKGLSVLVNQGPNGDYQGGKVKGKFISEDNGLTWDFSEEVDSDELTEE